MMSLTPMTSASFTQRKRPMAGPFMRWIPGLRAMAMAGTITAPIFRPRPRTRCSNISRPYERGTWRRPVLAWREIMPLDRKLFAIVVWIGVVANWSFAVWAVFFDPHALLNTFG